MVDINGVLDAIRVRFNESVPESEPMVPLAEHSELPPETRVEFDPGDGITQAGVIDLHLKGEGGYAHLRMLGDEVVTLDPSAKIRVVG